MDSDEAIKDVSLSSDEIDDLCNVCNKKCASPTGEVSYCTDCNIYLCKLCAEAHAAGQDTENHTLKTGKQESDPSQGFHIKPTEECSVHEGEYLRFYCEKHDTVCCSSCVIQTHKTCKATNIENHIQGFLEGRGHKLVLLDVDKFELCVQQCEGSIKNNLKKADDIASAAVEDFRKFKKDIIEFLDKQEDVILEKVQVFQTANKTQLECLSQECAIFVEKVNQYRVKLTKHKREPYQKFVQAKTIAQELSKMKTALDTIYNQNNVAYYSYIPCNTMKQYLSANSSIGTVKSSCIMGRKVVFEMDMSVKVADDKNKCCIMGCDLMGPDLMIMADSTNKCVKTVSTETGSVLSKLSLGTMIFDVTSVTHSTAAVTLPARRVIQFLTVRKKISKGREIKVSEECYGIQAQDDKLFVSFPSTLPPKIQIMTLQGATLANITGDINGDEIFKWPQYLLVIDDMIFVSDSTRQEVIKLSMQGEVMSRYSDKELGGPAGLTDTGDGHLLVCCNNWRKHNVQILNTDCKKIGAVFDDTVEIKDPYALCFGKSTNRIYVSSKCEKTGEVIVKSFKFS